MNVLIALAAVLALVVVAWAGTELAGLEILFVGVFPYLALVAFVVGVVYRVAFKWGRAPVPFRIPTTCGQQKTLPWIESSYVDNPHTTLGVVLRMALEILLFRSLFRNTTTTVVAGEQRVAYGPSVWLWLAGLAFHWSMLVVLFRHLRLFMNDVPWLVTLVQQADAFFQVGVPELYATSVLFLGALTFLFLRRLATPTVRYISLLGDYFPLFLLLGIGTTGFLLRHFVKTDVVEVKKLTVGLISFSPRISEDIHFLFYVHVFLVSTLLAWLPWSKVMHMAGTFLSPTRNLANNNRAKRHVNPWNYPVEVHTYEEYEEEFRDKMIEAGLPVEHDPAAR